MSNVQASCLNIDINNTEFHRSDHVESVTELALWLVPAINARLAPPPPKRL